MRSELILFALTFSTIAGQHIQTENNSGSDSQFSHRSAFPQPDYNEWQPLGPGDPLKNDPTFQYAPPVLNRVPFNAEANSRQGLWPIRPRNPPVGVAVPANRRRDGPFNGGGLPFWHFPRRKPRPQKNFRPPAARPGGLNYVRGPQYGQQPIEQKIDTDDEVYSYHQNYEPQRITEENNYEQQEQFHAPTEQEQYTPTEQEQYRPPTEQEQTYFNLQQEYEESTEHFHQQPNEEQFLRPSTEQNFYQPTEHNFQHQPTEQHFERRPTKQHFERQPTEQHFERQPTEQHFERQPTEQHFERQPTKHFERQPTEHFKHQHTEQYFQHQPTEKQHFQHQTEENNFSEFHFNQESNKVVTEPNFQHSSPQFTNVFQPDKIQEKIDHQEQPTEGFVRFPQPSTDENKIFFNAPIKEIAPPKRPVLVQSTVPQPPPSTKQTFSPSTSKTTTTTTTTTTTPKPTTTRRKVIRFSPPSRRTRPRQKTTTAKPFIFTTRRTTSKPIITTEKRTTTTATTTIRNVQQLSTTDKLEKMKEMMSALKPKEQQGPKRKRVSLSDLIGKRPSSKSRATRRPYRRPSRPSTTTEKELTSTAKNRREQINRLIASELLSKKRRPTRRPTTNRFNKYQTVPTRKSTTEQPTVKVTHATRPPWRKTTTSAPTTKKWATKRIATVPPSQLHSALLPGSLPFTVGAVHQHQGIVQIESPQTNDNNYSRIKMFGINTDKRMKPSKKIQKTDELQTPPSNEVKSVARTPQKSFPILKETVIKTVKAPSFNAKPLKTTNVKPLLPKVQIEEKAKANPKKSTTTVSHQSTTTTPKVTTISKTKPNPTTKKVKPFRPTQKPQRLTPIATKPTQNPQRLAPTTTKRFHQSSVIDNLYSTEDDLSFGDDTFVPSRPFRPVVARHPESAQQKPQTTNFIDRIDTIQATEHNQPLSEITNQKQPLQNNFPNQPTRTRRPGPGASWMTGLLSSLFGGTGNNKRPEEPPETVSPVSLLSGLFGGRPLPPPPPRTSTNVHQPTESSEDLLAASSSSPVISETFAPPPKFREVPALSGLFAGVFPRQPVRAPSTSSQKTRPVFFNKRQKSEDRMGEAEVSKPFEYIEHLERFNQRLPPPPELIEPATHKPLLIATRVPQELQQLVQTQQKIQVNKN